MIILSMAGLLFQTGACFGAEPEPAGSARQVEATVIHVDQYGVYAPNMIFYFDTHMDKRKVASLTSTANRLRNKKAVITYSSAGDKRMVLLDIYPEGGKPVEAWAEQPIGQASKPAGEPEMSQPKSAPQEQAAIEDGVQRRPGQTVSPQDKPSQARPAAELAPITRAEITDFVRRLLDLNEKKDLAAVIPFYADQVNYYDRGVVSRDYIKRDLGYYYRDWEIITTTLEGDVVMIALDQPDLRIAKFISSYSVKNARKSSAGKTENIWRIQRIDGRLKLIDVKQKILGREPSR